MSENATTFDVVIVGAGPGGLAAATTAAAAGRSVALLDDAPFPGGQIWRHQGHPVAAAKRLIDALGNVTHLSQARVIAKPAPLTLLVDAPAGPRHVRWKSLVLATGTRERFLPFPGWTLPGVVGAGGMQALVKQGLPVAGKRIVVAGTGPLLLAVAELLRAKGAVVPVIIEQAPGGRINRFGLSLMRTPVKLLAGVTLRAKLLGTRYATDSYVTAVTAPARPSGPPLNGDGLRVEYVSQSRTATVDCDYLACGFDLIPNNELPQLLGCQTTGDGFVRVDGQLRTTVSGIYAVGEVTGIGGVDKAVVEGRIAAHAIVGDTAAAARLAGAHAAALAFSRRLAEAFALRPELKALARPDTIVCRCEDVPLSAVQRSMSGRDAKLQTRCGMGACQGRVCGPILHHLCGSEPPTVRPPVFATSIRTLAAVPTGVEPSTE
jgi:NADPH-dependent 2,4-dienoyl-CoA reductase/sulfur reductase-like enzyme